MISFILALALAQNPVGPSQVPVIGGWEPRAASPWVRSERATCGSNVLTISGYGGGRPLDRVAEVLVNGRPVTGKAVSQFRKDLSNGWAVYRFQMLCGIPGGITVRITEGEKQKEGPVRYRSGLAFIRGNLLVSYSGLQEADADSYWFR